MLTYLSASDPGLVRQGEDRRSTDPESGKVEVIRNYRCRTAYVPLARTLLVPGISLEESSDLKLQTSPEETEEIGFTLFTCTYVGFDSTIAAGIVAPPFIKTTNYMVLDIVENEIIYSIRVGYPTYTQEFTYAVGAAAPLFNVPLFSKSNHTLQRVGQTDGEGLSDQWLWAILQETAREETTYADTVELTQSMSWSPVVFPEGENLSHAEIIKFQGFRYTWIDTF